LEGWGAFPALFFYLFCIFLSTVLMLGDGLTRLLLRWYLLLLRLYLLLLLLVSPAAALVKICAAMPSCSWIFLG
jgi:hypothetical protein